MIMDIKPFLEKHTNGLVSELSQLLERDIPEDVRCIQIMVFRESLPGIPFWVYFLNRFQGSAQRIKPFELLSSAEVLIDDEGYLSREEAICDCLALDNESEKESCMHAVYEKYNSDNLLVAQWVADCWEKAGGCSSEIPAFVVEEDCQFNPINLTTGKMIKHMEEYSGIFDG